MTDVHEIRRKNLIELISMYKSVANLNSALGRKRYDGTFNQIKNKSQPPSAKTPRVMGAEVAREIEMKLHLQPGWMDVVHDKPQTELIKESENFLKSSFKSRRSYRLNSATPSNLTFTLFDGEMKLSDYFIKSVLKATSEENLRFVVVEDNSLKSKCKIGDALILDFGVNTFTREGIYLIEVNGEQLLRLISIDYEGGYQIRTDDFSQRLTDLSKIKILAKALYVCTGTSL